MVGIRWEALRSSPFAGAVEAELAASGPLAFPDLKCLLEARQIVISSPALLAAEAGNFPAAMVGQEAQRAGLRRSGYRGVTLWMPAKPAALGVAQISEQIVLVGARKTLESAIDQSMIETGRQYSSLLPRAARFSESGDLWVVALKLPDPLASLFVPLEVKALDFEGQVSVRGGLNLEAAFEAGSGSEAASIAADLQAQTPSFPQIARGLRASSDHSTVTIELAATQEELDAAVRAPAVGPPARATQTAQAPAVYPPQASAAAATPPASQTPKENAKPPEPNVIRIIGLEGGPREIRVPPAQP